MSIASIVRTAGPFAGTGSLVALPFEFKVFAASDLVVQRTSTSGSVTTLTLTTHYSVSLNADQDTSPGGTVTLVTALASGETAMVTSNVAATQPLQLASGGPFLPQQIEDALDRTMIIVQQQGVLGDQTLRLPLGQSVPELPTLASLEGRVLGVIDGRVVGLDPSSPSAVVLEANLASPADGKGATLVGLHDAANLYAATEVEAALAEIGAARAIFVTDPRFGAVGNGTADDTAAIQAAINYCCTIGKYHKLIIPYGAAGVYRVTAQLNVTAAITIEWENSNISLKKSFNGDVFFVSSGLVRFVNPGIDGNGAAGFAGGGIRFANVASFTFDCSVENPRILNTIDSCVIFNGPRGGSGARVSGGTMVPYSTGGSGSGYPAIRLSGQADNDATPRHVTDVNSSSSPLIDVTGMVTTFVKGGQCATLLFGGNPDVVGATFISAKASIVGVRVRDGMQVRGEDHVIDDCVSHGVAPQYSAYGVLTTPLTVGLNFHTDANNCVAGPGNIIINRITDSASGLGDGINKYWQVNAGYTPEWSAAGSNPSIGNGSIIGVYNVSGAMVDVHIMLVPGSTTTFGAGSYRFSLPKTISAAAFRGQGTARVFNSGVLAGEIGVVVEQTRASPPRVEIYGIAGNAFSPTVPHTLKNGDFIEINFRYLRG